MILICLDLDGTLEDSRSDMVAVVHRVRNQLGLSPLPDKAIRPWVNKGMDPLYRACFDEYIHKEDSLLSDVRSRYETDYFNNVAVETNLYPGIASALEWLVDLGRLVVVTNKPEKISRRLLEALKVDHCFADVIGGDTCAKGKPDPMVLKEAADRVGFTKGEGDVFMIGDTSADLKMGRAFGATTIWCAWGYADDPGEVPDLVAQTPEELPGIVHARRGS